MRICDEIRPTSATVGKTHSGCLIVKPAPTCDMGLRLRNARCVVLAIAALGHRLRQQGGLTWQATVESQHHVAIAHIKKASRKGVCV